MARKKEPPATDAPGMSFEDALAGLEAIVDAMEHEQLPLEDLVSNYEQGSALLQRCETILQSARSRIELITLRNHAAPAQDTAAPPRPSSEDEDSNNDDDIRLF